MHKRGILRHNYKLHSHNNNMDIQSINMYIMCIFLKFILLSSNMFVEKYVPLLFSRKSIIKN